MTSQIENTTDGTVENIDEEAQVADETNAGRFKRIASSRLNKAIKAISLLENCAGYGYEYTDEQVTKMISHLNNAVEKVNKAYNKQKAKDEQILL